MGRRGSGRSDDGPDSVRRSDFLGISANAVAARVIPSSAAGKRAPNDNPTDTMTHHKTTTVRTFALSLGSILLVAGAASAETATPAAKAKEAPALMAAVQKVNAEKHKAYRDARAAQRKAEEAKLRAAADKMRNSANMAFAAGVTSGAMQIGAAGVTAKGASSGAKVQKGAAAKNGLGQGSKALMNAHKSAAIQGKDKAAEKAEAANARKINLAKEEAQNATTAKNKAIEFMSAIEAANHDAARKIAK